MTKSMRMELLDPRYLAKSFVADAKDQVKFLGQLINVVGLIASEDKPSLAYARSTKKNFEDLGMHYDLRSIERLSLESEILALNKDPNVHGVFIYFPIFNNQQDDYLRNLVDYKKDIEAGGSYWTRKLYANDRFAIRGDATKKALLPCTPLAILKMLSHITAYGTSAEKPLENKVVTIFNRSEVIGRPLAVMMSNDGAKVYSFDLNGALKFEHAKPAETTITRAEALALSDIVITGVPGDKFEKIQSAEIARGTVCVNFSSSANFSDDIGQHTDKYIPRVGPMTVAMCMRNTLRLFNNYHS